MTRSMKAATARASAKSALTVSSRYSFLTFEFTGNPDRPRRTTGYASTTRRHRSMSLYEMPCLSFSTEIVSVMMVFSQSAGLVTKSA